MFKINIKALSVNLAWQGKRFKTKKYKYYITEMMYILPPLKVSKNKLTLEVTFGFSCEKSDIDNPLKCFIDCLEKKYKFNDKMIFKLIVEKEIVEKGSEFISFSLYDKI